MADKRVLLLRDTLGGRAEVAAVDEHGRTAVVVRSLTQRTTKLIDTYGVTARFSPRADAVLWLISGGAGGLYVTQLAAGAELSRVSSLSDVDFAWLPDGRRVLVIPRNQQTSRVILVDATHPASTISRTVSTPIARVAGTLPGDWLATIPDVKDQIGARTLSLAQIDISGQGRLTRTFTLSLPCPVTVADAAISHDGSQVLWMVAHSPAWGRSPLLRMLFPSVYSRAPYYSLYISRADCSSVRELGQLEGGTTPVSLIGWASDDKFVSFVHDRVLWTVGTGSTTGQ